MYNHWNNDNSFTLDKLDNSFTKNLLEDSQLITAEQSQFLHRAINRAGLSRPNPSTPGWIIVLAAINSIKTSLPTAVFITILKDVKELPLIESGPLFFGVWITAAISSYWMELNKIKERLQSKFEGEALSQETDLKIDTLYFFDLIKKDQSLELHYLVITKTGNPEIKSLQNLKNSIQQEIRDLRFNQLLEKEYSQLVKALDPSHRPALKTDATFIPGNEVDNYLFLKCMLSLSLHSMASGALLGLSLTKGYENTWIKVVAALSFAFVNSVKNMITEPVVALSSHNAHIFQTRSDNLKSLSEQWGFSLILNTYSLAFLRDFAPALISATSVVGLHSLLSTWISSPVACWVACLPFYAFATSGFRVFTLSATKKLLEGTGTQFSVENSYSRYYERVIFGDDTCLLPLNRFADYSLWVMGELLAWRYSTIDFWLQRGFSHRKIAKALVVSMIIAGVALLYQPINDYLICPQKGCFGEGNGSLLSFLLTPKWLDAQAENHPSAFSLAFIATLVMLIITTTVSLWSQKPITEEYTAERYKIFRRTEVTESDRIVFTESEVDATQFIRNTDYSLMPTVYDNNPLEIIERDGKRTIRTITRVCSLPELGKETILPMTIVNLRQNLTHKDSCLSQAPRSTLYSQPEVNEPEARSWCCNL